MFLIKIERKCHGNILIGYQMWTKKKKNVNINNNNNNIRTKKKRVKICISTM